MATSTGNTDTKLAEAFGKQATIGSTPVVNTTYESTVQPPITGFSKNGGRHHRHHAYGRHPSTVSRPSVFDLDTAYQKHHSSLQELQKAHYESSRSAQPAFGQQSFGQQGVQSTSAAQPTTEAQKAEYEAAYKAAKEQEKTEMVKFEAIRTEVNNLITSQDWNKMESSHVHDLGTKLRELENRFWQLKPVSERLVLQGRNKLAEHVDLAEEELLHAIIVVSQIYRNRVKAAAHTKYPGKVHPIYHHAAAHHAADRQAAHHAQLSSYGGNYGHPANYHGHPSAYHQSSSYGAHPASFGPASYGAPHPASQRNYLGHGHPGHRGYAGQEDFGVQPYHGHPAMGYGGYY